MVQVVQVVVVVVVVVAGIVVLVVTLKVTWWAVVVVLVVLVVQGLKGCAVWLGGVGGGVICRLGGRPTIPLVLGSAALNP